MKYRVLANNLFFLSFGLKISQIWLLIWFAFLRVGFQNKKVIL